VLHFGAAFLQHSLQNAQSIAFTVHGKGRIGRVSFVGSAWVFPAAGFCPSAIFPDDGNSFLASQALAAFFSAAGQTPNIGYNVSLNAFELDCV
jgi:hypothetical protein